MNSRERKGKKERERAHQGKARESRYSYYSSDPWLGYFLFRHVSCESVGAALCAWHIRVFAQSCTWRASYTRR